MLISILFASLSYANPDACPGHTERAVCFVEGDRRQQRECVEHEDREIVIEQLETVARQMHPIMQQVYCHVTRINIELDMEVPMGYATNHYEVDENGEFVLRGHLMGLRFEPLFKAGHSIDTFLNGQVQINFGGDRLNPSADFPVQFHLESLPKTNMPLYHVLVHEFAHFLDFANSVVSADVVNEEDCEGPDTSRCLLQHSGEFANFSWPETFAPLQQEYYPTRPENDFLNRENLFCFRPGCMSLVEDTAISMAQGWLDSTFVSFYASTRPQEDFAEALTFWMHTQWSGLEYSVTIDGQYHNLGERMLRHDNLAKGRFVEAFLNRTDLVFLKESEEHSHGAH